MDTVSKIIAYEDGELDEQEVIELFQELLNTGQVWHLQGHYQRTAQALIEAGHCHWPVKNTKRTLRPALRGVGYSGKYELGGSD